MKKHEAELATILKKYCLKLKIFEDFIKNLFLFTEKLAT